MPIGKIASITSLFYRIKTLNTKMIREKQETNTFQKLEKEEVQNLINEHRTRVRRLNTHLQSLQQKLYGAAPHRDHAHLQRGADARPHICLQAGPTAPNRIRVLMTNCYGSSQKGKVTVVTVELRRLGTSIGLIYSPLISTFP